MKGCSWTSFILIGVCVCVCLPELDDLLLSLEQVQHCLDSDQQSQEDLQLVMGLLRTSDFQAAFQLHCAIALGMQRISPPFPLTAQAQALCQEVRRPRMLARSTAHGS